MSNKTVKSTRLLNEIIRRIMAGDTIKNICDKPGMPNRSTIHRWLMNDKEFSEAYRKAAAVRAHEFIVEALEIADRDKKTSKDVAADRLRISTRLKLAAVLNPNHFSARPEAKRKKAEDTDKDIHIEIIQYGSPAHRAREPHLFVEHNTSHMDVNRNE
jgi:hypothetical protein